MLLVIVDKINSINIESGNKKPSELTMEKHVFRRNNLFRVGQTIEAENGGVEFKCYEDTIHRVKFLGFDDEEKQLYRCRMIAFTGEDTDYHWYLHELHAIEKSQDNKEFVPGDKVHVRIRNRVGKVSNHKYSTTLDGCQSRSGIWVKAVVLDVLPDKKYIVEHVEWNEVTSNRGRSTTIVIQKDIRDVYK